MGKRRRVKQSASRVANSPGQTVERRAKLAGGFEGGRPLRGRRKRVYDPSPLLGRLRRLEVIMLAYMDPLPKERLTSAQIRKILDAIRDIHAGSESRREAMEVPEGRESERDVHSDLFDRKVVLPAEVETFVAAEDGSLIEAKKE